MDRTSIFLVKQIIAYLVPFKALLTFRIASYQPTSTLAQERIMGLTLPEEIMTRAIRLYFGSLVTFSSRNLAAELCKVIKSAMITSML